MLLMSSSHKTHQYLYVLILQLRSSQSCLQINKFNLASSTMQHSKAWELLVGKKGPKTVPLGTAAQVKHAATQNP